MFVHSSRIKKQFDYLSLKGFDIKPLYKQIDIKEGYVIDASKTFKLEQYNWVLEFALRQTNNLNYGLKFGSEPQLGGTIGTLSASCQNLREAFIQGIQFLKLQGNFAELSFHEKGDTAKLVYKIADTWTLQYPHTAKLEVDAMFAFLNCIININSNNTLRARKINLCFQKPKKVSDYESTFNLLPNFNASQNEMIFNAKDLLIPMKAFNPETFNILKNHLETELKNLKRSKTLEEKVRSILLTSMQYQFPDIEEVAKKLYISSRSLQRKLSDENTSFSTILKETRINLAKQLIKQNDLNISEIAFTLGYSDLANFSRSFKKVVTVSPNEYRDSIL